MDLERALLGDCEQVIFQFVVNAQPRSSRISGGIGVKDMGEERGSRMRVKN